ncbi:MAG TPA: hypothetical protein VID47_15340 [Actinomycetota bacterium]
MRRILAVSAAALVIAAFGSIDASGAHGKPKVDFLGRARAGANTAPVTHWCNTNGVTCTEPYQNWEDFSWFDRVSKQVNINEYIGHDEPSLLFYSHNAGAGNNQTYDLTLPKEPTVTPRQDGGGGSANFQIRPTFWLGMAMCDDESAPNPDYPGSMYPASTHCTPDSDSNIFIGEDPTDASTYMGAHPGTAFMEMQFYPPGWVPWPLGTSCDATQWCAALNIDSFSQDMNTNAVNNNDCLNSAGLEPVNFAFLTPTGTSETSADPLNNARFTPTSDTYLMGGGDRIEVGMQDTSDGFTVRLDDLTTGTHGSMVASAANGFASVNFDPSASSCSITKHAFHPAYSTSSENTRVPWAAHSYNVAISDEIGHFEYCNKVRADAILSCADPGGFDTNTHEPDTGDDNACLPIPGVPSTDSLLIKVKGCLGSFGDSDLDFDGVSYDDHAWPGSTSNEAVNKALASSALQFNSPTFSGGQNYGRVAFEADLPRIEDFRPDAPFGGVTVNCQRFISNPSDPHPGQDCVKPPPQSRFYPTYSTGTLNGQCTWQLGGKYLPGTTNRFGGINEWGPLLVNRYPGTDSSGSPAVSTRFNNFRQVLPQNPCPTEAS